MSSSFVNFGGVRIQTNETKPSLPKHGSSMQCTGRRRARGMAHTAHEGHRTHGTEGRPEGSPSQQGWPWPMSPQAENAGSPQGTDSTSHPPGMSQQRTVPSRLADSSQRQSSDTCMSVMPAPCPRNWRTRRAACRGGGSPGTRGGWRSAAGRAGKRRAGMQAWLWGGCQGSDRQQARQAGKRQAGRWPRSV